MQHPLSKKQLEFILDSTKRWNIAHGAVSTGKTVCTLFRFMESLESCPDSEIAMIGKTSTTLYNNCIKLLFEDPTLCLFKPFCTWYPSKRELTYKDKTITTYGAKDEGSTAIIQGRTLSRAYCDEMTLYPDSFIHMLDTRLRKEYSMGFAAMNPSHPEHPIKKWIDMAEQGHPKYYSMHFILDDNPYLPEDYKETVKNSLTGLFYKRNILGLWCLAEGAIFEFFDHAHHVVTRPPCAAEYWVAGIDYGTANAFACVLIGVNTGHTTQSDPKMWVEKEYYWDSKKQGRQKTNAEYARDVVEFLEPYGPKAVYVDPSAAAFKLELRRKGLTVVDADNDVMNGIQTMGNRMQNGTLVICKECKNLIREIGSYVWDARSAKLGEDEPLKENDHCFCAGTKVETYWGLKNIEDVEVEEYVYTRTGLQLVERTGFNDKECFEYELYGKTIRCTSDHKFFTERGWIEIGDLIQSDILYTMDLLWDKLDIVSYERMKWLNLKEGDIDGIQILKNSMNVVITQPMGDICIEQFMPPSMGKYPKDIIFITSTVTPVTMIYPICNVLAKTNISHCIKMILNLIAFQINVERQQKNGISLIQAGNGIDGMLTEQDLESLLKFSQRVKNAENLTQLLTDPTVDFVRITVKVSGEENLDLMMSRELALHAIQYLDAINMQENSIVPALAQGKPIGEQKVYNLQVANKSEFFAEGFLVHNSIDATRYAIYTHKVAKYQPYQHNPNQYMQSRFGR